MEKMTYSQLLKKYGFSYLGNTQQSTKMKLSYNNGYETYNIYLAPATMARDKNHPQLNVCPNSKNCRDACLQGSGVNKCDTLYRGVQFSKTNIARRKKTHLFYDNRNEFMELLIHELKKYRKHAQNNNMGFAVRLNCTSDLSPLTFKYNGKNILELFPDVQFYDYTKVRNRTNLCKQYPNYDITFSFDGDNWDFCKEYLQNGGKVAVVFDIKDDNGKQTLPKYYKGYKVVDANNDDMRFLNEPGTIIGLHYHTTANNYKNGKYEDIDTPFIIKITDNGIEM